LLPRSLAQTCPAPTLERLTMAAPLIRFNVDSHIGETIERHLGAYGVAPARRLEIDTADSLVAMVAEGIGWALITPLCLLQARVDPEAVVVAPLPGEGLARELTLIARRGEYGDLPQRIAATAATIFDEQWRPKLARMAPWLANTVTVG
jgi:DNA-binding transcriptional LysR family regulator